MAQRMTYNTDIIAELLTAKLKGQSLLSYNWQTLALPGRPKLPVIDSVSIDWDWNCFLIHTDQGNYPCDFFATEGSTNE